MKGFPMIRVIGLDPSLSATGVAYPSGKCVTWKPSKGADDVAGRLHELYCKLSANLQHLRAADAIDFAVIESVMPNGSQGQAVARKALAQLSGVFLLALYESAVPFVEVNPISLKKYATDKGTAQKDEMIREARSAGATVANDNEADAWWLRQIGHDFYNMTPAEASNLLTKYQLELHDRITWPRL